MKLIDLLVQELPKRGGWPDGVDSIHQDHDGEIYAWTGSSAKLLFRTGIIADNCRPYGLDESIENMVTRNQYKSVFALSQKPAWNGEGLPPVGVECESKQFAQIDWREFRVVAVENGHVFGFWHDNVGACLDSTHWMFRPLRTESERKHEAALESICAVLEMVGKITSARMKPNSFMKPSQQARFPALNWRIKTIFSVVEILCYAIIIFVLCMLIR